MKKILLFIGIIILILFIPYGLNFAIGIDLVATNLPKNDWLNFYANYLGSLIGALVAYSVAKYQFYLIEKRDTEESKKEEILLIKWLLKNYFKIILDELSEISELGTKANLKNYNLTKINDQYSYIKRISLWDIEHLEMLTELMHYVDRLTLLQKTIISNDEEISATIINGYRNNKMSEVEIENELKIINEIELIRDNKFSLFKEISMKIRSIHSELVDYSNKIYS